MDVVQILVAGQSLVVLVQPGIITGDVGGQGGGGDVLAVDAGAHALVQIGDTGLQHLGHVLGLDLEDQVFDLIDQKSFLNIKDHGSIIKVKDHIFALVRVFIDYSLDPGPGGRRPVAGDQLSGIGLIVAGGVDGRGIGGRIPGDADVQRLRQIPDLEEVVAVVDIVRFHLDGLAVHTDLGGGRVDGQRRKSSGHTQPQSGRQAKGEDLAADMMLLHKRSPPKYSMSLEQAAPAQPRSLSFCRLSLLPGKGRAIITQACFPLQRSIVISPYATISPSLFVQFIHFYLPIFLSFY